MTDQRDQKPKLILPETEGIPNLEVRRMMRELETTKQPAKINPQTAQQISLHLDQLQKLTQNSQVQGMVICALLLKGAHPRGEALTLFGVPNQDKTVARELLDYSHGWLLQCAEEIEKPPPEAG
jgi:hypothetical protein